MYLLRLECESVLCSPIDCKQKILNVKTVKIDKINIKYVQEQVKELMKIGQEKVTEMNSDVNSDP